MTSSFGAGFKKPQAEADVLGKVTCPPAFLVPGKETL